MHLIAVASLLGYFASSALATCDSTCPPNTIPTCATSGDTCLAPTVPLKSRRAFSLPLLRRDCSSCTPTECPADRKKCIPGGTKPPQLPATTKIFDCGQHATDKSVTVTYVNCPGDPANKCLVFTLSDPALEAPKLEISSNHLTDDSPGQFSYSKDPNSNYCTATSCVVPISVVLSREGKTAADLCGLTLWIGLHSGLGSDTCWPQGSEIQDGDKNWAQEFSITFECPTYPETCCCCPAPPETKPPKKCGSETAYASRGNTFNLPDLGCTKAWGFYQKYPAADVNALADGSTIYTADLLAGKTNDVGDVSVVKKSGTCFTVILDAATGFGVGKTHIDISCADPKANLGGFCRTPGKYEFKSGCISVDPYSSGDVCVDTACPTGSYYYFIIHAETYKVVEYDPANPGPYDTCSAYTCGSD